MSGLAGKKIEKRSGLVGPGSTAAPLSGKDMSAAAARMPSFDFASSGPVKDTASVAPTPLEASPAPSTHAALPFGLTASQVVAVARIRVALLDPSPYQPRLKYDEGKLAELAESLRHGQIDPLLVRPKPNGRFELISGHRRTLAAPMAQREELECRVVEVSDSVARILVLAANEPREDFTDYERALGYRNILEDGKSGGEVRSQRQLASRIGVDVGLVNRRLSMLDLPDVVQDILRNYPGAFSCRWVKKLQELTGATFDSERLKGALLRVATRELQMTAVFSIMAGSAKSPVKESPQPGLSLQRANRLFAQITPNPGKRQVMVKLPGDCDIDEVANLILAALNSRFAGEAK